MNGQNNLIYFYLWRCFEMSEFAIHFLKMLGWLGGALLIKMLP